MKHTLKRALFWLSWPFLFIYFSSHARSRVVLVKPSGKLLLVQGNWKQLFDDTGYGIPGGGIKTGEAPAVGAARELAEELAIEVTPDELELLGDELVTEYRLRYRAYFYRLSVAEDIKLQPDAKEIANVRWFDSAELTEAALKPEVRQALALLAAAA